MTSILNCCRILLYVILPFAMLWCSGVLWYQRRIVSVPGRILLLALYLACMLALLIFGWKRVYLPAAGFLLTCGIIVLWMLFTHPTGKLDWDPPFRILPVIHFSEDGKSFTVQNLRDFHYRTEDDYDIRYRTETYRFEDITSMDYSITHWNGSELFGHIILSFHFRDGRLLALSPEARLERGKKYEIIPGMFRRYELMFIFATEEDVFQLRTHHRKYEQEEVFLYPTTLPPEKIVPFLQDLLRRTNVLAEHPEFYNGITYNCLSTLAPSAEKLSSRFCSGWHGTFNGITDGIAFRQGLLADIRPGETFEAYKKRHSVNQYVEHLKDPPDFSKRIRPE